MRMQHHRLAVRLQALASLAWVKRLQGLDVRRPELWPVLGQRCFLVGAGFFLWLVLLLVFVTDYKIELETLQTEQQQLQRQIRLQREKAAPLASLLSESHELQAHIAHLSVPLPDQAHWDQLLSALNQAGHRQQLVLEEFKPDAIRVCAQWVELPASIVLKGEFHAMGRFVSELAHFDRLVALEQLHLEASAKNTVTLRAKLKAYRQRTPAEAAAFREEKTVRAGLAFWPVPSTDYDASHRPDPFKPRAIPSVPKAAHSSVPRSKQVSTSNKHPLETAPLDAMRLVGQLLQGDRRVGLIRFNGAVYPVQVGAVLGVKQGRVSSVDSAGLLVLEPSTDASGRQFQESTFIPMTGSTR